jgi:serine/threonine protein kinase
VYLGRHNTLKRIVAIKVLHPHLSASTRNRQRFAREARAIEHLDHDNILQIFDYSGSDTEDCFIVTEFVQGQTLSTLLQERGMIPSELAALIGVHLCEALAYAHESGIIHRDLKPENVMLRDDGVVKLMDFGIARFLDESTVTMTGTLIGSPAYMSPEQALERSVDSRSDLFSLGSLLFHLVTGRLPFPGTNPSIILRKIIEGNRPEVLELQPGVSPQVADCIERLMQTDPGDRYEDAKQVAEQLRNALQQADMDEVKEPQWRPETYLQNPDEWESRLRAHLDVVLLERGRKAFSEGDHLDAQRLFNRLLAWNPEHPEVLDLLSSFHYPDVTQAAPSDKTGQRWPWIGAVLALLISGAAWNFLQPSEEPFKTSPMESLTEAKPPLSFQMSPVELAVESTAPTGPMPEIQAKLLEQARPTKQPSQTVPVPQKVLTLPEPVLEPVLPQKAFVRVSLDSPTWGDVYIDEKLVFNGLRQPQVLEIVAGTHTIGVSNPLSTKFTREFTVEEGETFDIQVSLTELLMTVILDGFSPLCEVMLGAIPMGTVESQDGVLRIKAPRQAAKLSLDCPEGPQSFELIGVPGDTKTISMP